MIAKQFILKNQQTVTIKEAEPSDAAPLLDYVNLVAGETDNLTFGEGEFEMSVADEAAYLQKSQQTPNMIYLLALVDEQIVGSLSFQVGSRERIQHTGEFGVSVMKTYWGLGIATRLVETLVTWAKATGTIRKINLRVRTDNKAAILLYEKLGFARQGIITREFVIDGEFYDSLSMGLELD